MKYNIPVDRKRIAVIIASALFIYSGVAKALSFPLFVSDVEHFDLLPLKMIIPLSICIVMTEVVAGIGLCICGMSKMFSFVLVILLSVFTAAMLFNLFRGNIVECGCFGSTISSEINWWSVLRNMILGVFLYWIFVKSEHNRGKK